MQKNFHDTKKELPNIVIAKWNPNGLYLLDSFGYWIETPTTLRGWSLNKKRWKKSGLRANTQNFWIDAEKRTTGAERRSWKKDRCWKKNEEFHFQNVEDYNVLIDALENGQIRSIELDNFIFKCRRLKCSDRCWNPLPTWIFIQWQRNWRKSQKNFQSKKFQFSRCSKKVECSDRCCPWLISR